MRRRRRGADRTRADVPGRYAGAARLPRWPVAVVLGVVVGAYANAIPNGFAFDDSEQILANVWLTDVRYLGRIFLSDVWAFRPGFVSNYYRPLMHVFYLATYQLFGPRPWAFHALSVLLHACNAVLVLFLARRVVGHPHGKGPGSAARALPGLAAGVLFGVHPVNTEAVAWAAGIPELSYSFFVLLALLMHIDAAEGRHGARWAAGVAFMMALLCKETALALLPLIAALECTWREPPQLGVVRRCLPLAAALGIYGVLRLAAIGGLGGMPPLPPYAGMGRTLYAANALRFLALYLGKLVWPVPLNAFHVIEPLVSPLAWQACVSALVIGASVVATALAGRRRHVACLALVVVIVPLLPTLLVPIYSHVPFSERYLYLPSVGLSLLVALLLQALDRRGARALAAGMAAIVVLAAVLTVATARRNRVWRDDLTLFADVTAKSPVGEIPNGMMGLALMRAGRYDESIPYLRLALEANPDSGRARLQLGHSLLKAGRAQEALPELERVMRQEPDPEILVDLAEACLATGDLDGAIVHYKALVAARPEDPEQHNWLGIALARAERYQEAQAQFDVAIGLNPAEPAYRRNRDRARERLAQGAKSSAVP